MSRLILTSFAIDVTNFPINMYNPFLVYCRELAPCTVSLTGDRAQGDDSKHDSHYNDMTNTTTTDIQLALRLD